MSLIRYCWRCDAEVPMLDETEWAEVEPLLLNRVREIKAYRQKHEAPLSEALARVSDGEALDRFFQITRYRETDIDRIRHHRLALFGEPCRDCGKPLRTPRAKFCAACGAAA